MLHKSFVDSLPGVSFVASEAEFPDRQPQAPAFRIITTRRVSEGFFPTRRQTQKHNPSLKQRVAMAPLNQQRDPPRGEVKLA
jgi:hypothetical protein